MMHRN